jgi:hypothetical protein
MHGSSASPWLALAVLAVCSLPLTLPPTQSPTPSKAGAGAPSDTRRVGAFTVTPDVARRLLAARIQASEQRRAEDQVMAALGARHVRFVQLALTWLGPAGDGPRLSPAYVPVYVFSWMHAGIKVGAAGASGRPPGLL